MLRKDSIHIFLDSRYYAKIKKIDKQFILDKTDKQEVHYHKLKGPIVDAMLLNCETSKTIELEENLTLKYFREINDKSDL
jgi:hypothetical protein